MERYQLRIDDQIIDYDVQFKRMKSLRIKVIEGRLVVSAPYGTPQKFIEDIMIKNKDRLLAQMTSYHPHAQYDDGGFVTIFQKRYHIVLRDIGQMTCRIHDDQIYVYHHQIQKVIEEYLKYLLMDYLKERIIFYLKHDFDLDMPTIEIKKYKGRWGSCFYREHKATFNLSLIHLDPKLIDYVIIHELTHFLQANHSPLFYQEIEKRMPDYKKRIRALKEEHI